jgi:Tol biopolymer transport system component
MDCSQEPNPLLQTTWDLKSKGQIYAMRPDGTDPIPAEPGAPLAYNVDPQVCHNGNILFTSNRTGTAQLYRTQLDSLGTFMDVRAITQSPTYKGEGKFSPDCQKIVWVELLPSENSTRTTVEASRSEIWIANADGTEAKQITNLKVRSLTPTFTPDGKNILFSSNFAPLTRGERHFDLYLISIHGTHLRKVTELGNLNAYPSFTSSGKKLLFSSNRDRVNPNENKMELDLFEADWNATELQPADPALKAGL